MVTRDERTSGSAMGGFGEHQTTCSPSAYPIWRRPVKPATSTNSRHAPNSSLEMSLVRPKVVTACTTVASAVLRLTRKVSRTGLEFALSFIPAGVRQGVHRSRRYRKCLAAGPCEEKSSFRGRAREGLRAGRSCAHETFAL